VGRVGALAAPTQAPLPAQTSSVGTRQADSIWLRLACIHTHILFDNFSTLCWLVGEGVSGHYQTTGIA